MGYMSCASLDYNSTRTSHLATSGWFVVKFRVAIINAKFQIRKRRYQPNLTLPNLTLPNLT